MRTPVVGALGRALPWPLAGGLLCLSVVPTAVTVARGGTELTGATTTASLVAPAALAYAFDDPARVVLDATPTPPPLRSALRMSLLLVGVTVALAITSVVGTTAAGTGNVTDPARVAAAATVGALSLAAAASAHHAGAADVSPGVVAIGPLTVLLVSSLSTRWPWLPSMGNDVHASRWWLVIAPAVVWAGWNARDPYQGHRSHPRELGSPVTE